MTKRTLLDLGGEYAIRLVDMKKYVWLTMEADLSAGDNRVPWNGLGANLERMFAGPYRIEVTLKDADGTERTASAKFNISGVTPTLVYALPSSETLYLDGSEKWFVEFYVSAPCYVDLDVLQDGKTVYTKSEWIAAEDGESIVLTLDATVQFYLRKNIERIPNEEGEGEHWIYDELKLTKAQYQNYLDVSLVVGDNTDDVIFELAQMVDENSQAILELAELLEG